jgi:hypothetical protein
MFRNRESDMPWKWHRRGMGFLLVVLSCITSDTDKPTVADTRLTVSRDDGMSDTAKSTVTCDGMSSNCMIRGDTEGSQEALENQGLRDELRRDEMKRWWRRRESNPPPLPLYRFTGAGLLGI